MRNQTNLAYVLLHTCSELFECNFVSLWSLNLWTYRHFCPANRKKLLGSLELNSYLKHCEEFNYSSMYCVVENIRIEV